MISFGLSARVIIVTGGGSGIGRALVRALAADGAKVAAADMHAANVEAVAGECDAMPLVFDVRDEAATRDAVARVADRLGPIDGLVCSAGTSRAARAEALSRDQWDLVIDSNLTGSFLSAQAVAGGMIAAGCGSIVFLSSLNGKGGHPGRAHYCASKAAVEGLTRDLACEWGRHGIRVNAVAPNVTDTPLVRANLPEDYVRDVIIDRTPLGRMAEPDEIAAACMFLLSEAASYITGIVLPVDGGISAGYLTHRSGAEYGSRALRN
ncbi:MAG TPA: SDR family NAD(P)-dependent oxidoreductase [Acetobacteraceae bacterium]|jgi:NAD(P)-dependent dehydrogenase (short-subunit alcohol dehydrogenase family)|nr:SDR family NAD(P)-dependent oxidoreductase [Acetobacteraceae bacterium]